MYCLLPSADLMASSALDFDCFEGSSEGSGSISGPYDEPSDDQPGTLGTSLTAASAGRSAAGREARQHSRYHGKSVPNASESSLNVNWHEWCRPKQTCFLCKQCQIWMGWPAFLVLKDYAYCSIIFCNLGLFFFCSLLFLILFMITPP